MADFVQTMKDWRRMCMGRRCDNCDLYKDCNIEPDSRTDEHIRRIYTKVNAWAADHPKPVYPTWIDVLKLYGVTDETGYKYLESAYRPIPADIAEKLGLQPKEDVC